MASTPLLACDDILLTHYPSLMMAASVSSIAMALHVAVALTTLLILANKFLKTKDRNSLKSLFFVFVLLVLAVAHLAVYLATRTICNRKHKIANYDARQALLETCVITAPTQDVDVGWFVQPVPEPCWRLTDPDPSRGWTRNATYEDITGERYFRQGFAGPSLHATQEALGLVVAILTQFYLLLRSHWVLRRKDVAAAMIVLYGAVVGFGIARLAFLPVESDPHQPSMTVDTSRFFPYMMLHRVYWNLTLLFTLCVNFLVIGRLIWLRAPLRLASDQPRSLAFYKRWAENTLLDRAFVVAAVLDSALLFSVALWNIAWTQEPDQPRVMRFFVPMLVQTQAMVVDVIILRIALGWYSLGRAQDEASDAGGDIGTAAQAPLLAAE